MNPHPKAAAAAAAVASVMSNSKASEAYFVCMIVHEYIAAYVQCSAKSL